MTSSPQAVKTLDGSSGRVGGYLVVWGSQAARDLQDEYFTPATDLGLDWFERRPVLYHHGLDGAVKTAVIGAIEALTPDAIGVWAEAQLDLRQKYARAVYRLIERGALSWSSGSLPHLVEVEPDGRIARWPLIEGSLTPSPAEPRQTDVRTIKTAFAMLGIDPARLSEAPPEKEQFAMTDPTISAPATETVPLKRLPVASPADAAKASEITVGSPYDGLDALDLLHGYVMLRAAKSFQGVSERFAGALAHKVRGAGLSALKADELNRSTLTGFGDEWVPDLWSAQIWRKARAENVVLPLFPQIEMPSNPFEVPTEGADPSVYYVPETADEAQLGLGSGNPIPDSKIGSGKVQLTARKLALRVGFSAELVEDAILPVLALYREQAVRAIADSIDYLILNGDTTTAATGNINKDHAAPAATDRYLAFDGLRKLPIVTNTANRVDAANVAPTLALLRSARFKLDPRASVRPADLAWLVNQNKNPDYPPQCDSGRRPSRSPARRACSKYLSDPPSGRARFGLPRATGESSWRGSATGDVERLASARAAWRSGHTGRAASAAIPRSSGPRCRHGMGRRGRRSD